MDNFRDDGSMDAMPNFLFEELMAQQAEKEKLGMQIPVANNVVKSNDMVADILGKVGGVKQGAMSFTEEQMANMANLNSNFKSQSFMTNPENMNQAASGFVTDPTVTQDGSMNTFSNNSGNIREEQFIPKEAEDLVMLGKLEKEIEFHGNKMVIRTLNGLDNINIIDEISRFKTPETKKAAGIVSVLVRAIKVFNGEKFYSEGAGDFVPAKFVNINQAKSWLLRIDQIILNALYGEYTKLLKEQQSLLGEVKK